MPCSCRMARISTAFDTEMGQTGAGIQHASEIDMNVRNSFTTKWGTHLPPPTLHHELIVRLRQTKSRMSARGTSTCAILSHNAPTSFRLA
jgi:hypothetical protein